MRVQLVFQVFFNSKFNVFFNLNFNLSQLSEAVARRCSVKTVFLEISQIHRKTPMSESLSGLRPATLLKKRPWHRFIPVNFAKFLRTSQNTSVAASELYVKLINDNK